MTHIFDQLLKAIAVMIIAMYSCVPPKNHIKYITDIPHMQWNVTPLLLRGSNFYFLQTLLSPYWSKCPVCTPDFRREAKVRAFRPIRVQYSL